MECTVSRSNSAKEKLARNFQTETHSFLTAVKVMVETQYLSNVI